jgi:hypothetical protein
MKLGIVQGGCTNIPYDEAWKRLTARLRKWTALRPEPTGPRGAS